MHRVYVESNISLRPAVSVFCFLFVFFLLLPLSLQAQQPGVPFEQYTVNDGLPSQLTYSVHQDRQGFIWVCTEAGVSRFDGRSFVNFTTEDGLGDNENLEIYEDKKGRLWFIPFSGKLSYYYEGKFYSEKNDSIIRFLPDHYINCGMPLTEDAYGNIYVPDADASKGVKRLSIDNKITTYSLKHIFNNPFDSPGVIYTSPDKKRVYYRLNNTEERLVQLFLSGEARELHVRPQKYHNDTRRYRPNTETGTVVFCNNDSLYSVEDTFFRPIMPVEYYDVILTDYRIDPYGNIWKTGLGGVMFFRKRNGYYDKPLLLMNGQRCNVYFDREDNIWMATATEGLYMMPYSRISDSKAFEINNNSINKRPLSIAADKDNGIWLGYDNGYISRCKDGHCEHYNLMEIDKQYTPGDYQRVIQIQVDRDGDVWCISNKFAVSLKRLSADRYASPRLLHEYHDVFKKTVPAFGFKSIYLDKDGDIRFSTAFTWAIYNNLKINKNTMVSARLSSLENELSPVRQYSAFSDSKGGLYASRMDGLHYSRDNKETLLYASDKRLRVRVQNFTENSEGVVFIATYSDGLIALKNLKVIATASKATGLPGIVCKRVYCIQDTLYLATNGGISILVFEHDSFRVLYNLGVKEGLSSPDVNDLAFLSHTLYAATSTGLSTFRLPFTGVKSVSAPVPVFTGFKVNEKLYDVRQPVRFPYGQQHISISYIAPVAANASRLQYRYRFADREDNWHTTSSGELEFSKLPFGSYKLELQAKKFNSDWSESRYMAFEIIPPFYNTWWFTLLLILSVSVLVVFIFRASLRRKLKQQLTEMKAREAIEQERQRIAADIHDDIGSELTNIMILSKMLKNKESQQAGSMVIDKIEASSSEVITKMNEVIWTLNAGNDTLFDLAAYLRDYVSRFSAQHNINTELNIDERVYVDYSVNAGQRRNVFLVLKEVLHNILKHASAQKVELQVSRPSAGMLVIRISDDGSGFDIAKVSGGNGLKNIKKRTEEMRGSVAIDSQPGKGTQISISIPI